MRQGLEIFSLIFVFFLCFISLVLGSTSQRYLQLFLKIYLISNLIELSKYWILVNKIRKMGKNREPNFSHEYRYD